MNMLVLLSVLLSLFATVFGQNPTLANLTANDNNVLRFALTLENMETAFLTNFQGIYTRDNFAAAPYNDATIYDAFNLILLHEQSHVSFLNQILRDRTGETIGPCSRYNFSAITNIQQYVAVIRLFENTGAGAYDGSIDAIYNKTLQQGAATIATIEARHAAFLNQLPGSFTPSFVPDPLSPFPNATDYAFEPLTVRALIAPFIDFSSCSYDVNAVLPSTYTITPVAAPNSTVPANPTAAQLLSNDLVALNYALSLEILEATFYNRYLETYQLAAFLANSLTADDYNNFLLIAAHENAHVKFLTDAITGNGGTPAPNCTYNFGVNSFATFISVAALLENTGVSAYDGAVNTINSLPLRQSAATVATVEARHASYLNQLVNKTRGSGFPFDFDTAIPPSQIIETVRTNFITGCNGYNISAPQVLVVNPYPITNNTGASTGTSTSSSSTTGGSAGTTTTTSGSRTTGTTTTSAAPSSLPAATLIFFVVASIALLL